MYQIPFWPYDLILDIVEAPVKAFIIDLSGPLKHRQEVVIRIVAQMADDIDEMREQFHTISEGGYADLLYNLFGKERVLKELDEFLAHDFMPRFGGGIGVTRMISGMKKAGLLVD